MGKKYNGIFIDTKNKETWLMNGDEKVEKINYIEKIVDSNGIDILGLIEEKSNE